MARSEWFETFFDGLYAKVLSSQFDAKKNREDAQLVRKLLRARKGQHVLDLPCGRGRIAIPLAKTGLQVTGVDLTRRLLAAARRGASREGVDIRFLHGDMREIEFEEEFHAGFNWFGSFGYFSDEQNLEVCRRMLRALRPGGRFLVEGIHQPWLLANFHKTDEREIGGVEIRMRNRWHARTRRVRAAWTLQKGTDRERHKLEMRIYTGPELRALLREAGFRHVTLHGRPPLGRLTDQSRRLIAVGVKPK